MEYHLKTYLKPPLTIEQQLKLLKTRGVVITDDAFASRILLTIGYYRLTAYLYPFRLKDGTDNFVPGTSADFQDIPRLSMGMPEGFEHSPLWQKEG